MAYTSEPKTTIRAERPCGHAFADHKEVHYCSYIRTQSIQRLLSTVSTTPDDLLAHGALLAVELWSSVIVADMTELARSRSPLEGAKRRARCDALAGLIDDALWLAFNELSPIIPRQKSRQDPRAAERDPATSELRRLLEAAAGSWASSALTYPATSVSKIRARDSMQLSAYAFDRLRRAMALRDLIYSSLKACELFDAIALEALGFPVEAVRHRHPSINGDPRSADQYTFVVAHQALECLFPACAATLSQAITVLTPSKGPVRCRGLNAGSLAIHRAGYLATLFARAIQLPLTITPVAYLLFRHELNGIGSGMESIGFRSIEFLAGRRADTAMSALSAAGLLTPALEELGQSRSVRDCVLQAIGVVAGTKWPTKNSAARGIIRLLTAPCDVHEFCLAQLIHAALALDAALAGWRLSHFHMASTMIGTRRTLGVGTAPPASPEAAAPTGGKMYLQRTLEDEWIFREIWEILGHMGDTAIDEDCDRYL